MSCLSSLSNHSIPLHFSTQPTTSTFKCFDNNTELRAAVVEYLLENPLKQSSLPSKQYGPTIGEWCVSRVTDFSRVFASDPENDQDARNLVLMQFNEPLSGWNTSAALNMSEFFMNAAHFNQPLDHFVVDKVTNFSRTFFGCHSLDRDLLSSSTWQNVSSAADTTDMFGLSASQHNILEDHKLKNESVSRDYPPDLKGQLDEDSRALLGQQDRENEAREDDRELQMRIIGGYPAMTGKYPGYVNAISCGGSLVWDNVILTAGHCMDALQKLTVPVSVGGISRFDLVEGEFSANLNKSSFTRHPQYSMTSVVSAQWDFLLIQIDTVPDAKSKVVDWNLQILEEEAAVSDDVVVDNRPADDENLTVIGMGRTSADSSSVSNKLLETYTYKLSDSLCDSDYGQLYESENMFCTFRDGADSCQGDSGSPIFMTKSVNGSFATENQTEFIQVGVVSLGFGCAEKPGVYSKLSAVQEWMKQTICTMANSDPTQVATIPDWCLPTENPTSSPTTTLPSSLPGSPTATPNAAPTDQTPGSPTTTPNAAPTAPSPTAPTPTSTPNAAPTAPGSPTTPPNAAPTAPTPGAPTATPNAAPTVPTPGSPTATPKMPTAPTPGSQTAVPNTAPTDPTPGSPTATPNAAPTAPTLGSPTATSNAPRAPTPGSPTASPNAAPTAPGSPTTMPNATSTAPASPTATPNAAPTGPTPAYPTATPNAAPTAPAYPTATPIAAPTAPTPTAPTPTAPTPTAPTPTAPTPTAPTPTAPTPPQRKKPHNNKKKKKKPLKEKKCLKVIRKKCNCGLHLRGDDCAKKIIKKGCKGRKDKRYTQKVNKAYTKKCREGKK